MLVISYGITKSGSTLAFELAKAVLSFSGFPQDRLAEHLLTPGHNINFTTEPNLETIDAILGSLAPGQRIVLKTHRAPPAEERPRLEALCREGLLKIQVAVRDPRDICLSLVDAGETARRNGHTAFSRIETLDTALRTVRRQIPNFRFWASLKDALLLPYEQCAFETETAVARISAQLGVVAPIDKVRRHVFDCAFTQFNKGVPNRHAAEMTEADDEKVRDQLADFFRDFVDVGEAGAAPGLAEAPSARLSLSER
ncbi:hypothetical protein L2U69_04275 [Zavarzinia compransoris]|uniref:hypothetical protein n=1 Tax=Zavarzinia marina TaxID=2911065 RepID=UPI001F3722A6|nr:hypothetical protein [Zavarzinia marina]MCF4164854.1 hypothetical protein [Zavarzinia marina]